MTAPDQADEQWAYLLASLETPCASCGGTGEVVPADWQRWQERADELMGLAKVARQTVDRMRNVEVGRPGGAAAAPFTGEQGSLHEPAVVAAIQRSIDEHLNAQPRMPKYVQCSRCDGSGRALTSTGERFVEFLGRHGFVRRRDL